MKDLLEEESLLLDAPPEEEEAPAVEADEEGMGVDFPSWWLLKTTRAVEEEVVVTL